MKISEKVKKVASKIGAALTGIGVTAATSVTAFAAETGTAEGTNVATEVLNSVKSGMTSANGSIVDLLKIAVPIIIGLVVGVVVAKAGIGWVKNIGSKAK